MTSEEEVEVEMTSEKEPNFLKVERLFPEQPFVNCPQGVANPPESKTFDLTWIYDLLSPTSIEIRFPKTTSTLSGRLPTPPPPPIPISAPTRRSNQYVSFFKGKPRSLAAAATKVLQLALRRHLRIGTGKFDNFCRTMFECLNCKKILKRRSKYVHTRTGERSLERLCSERRFCPKGNKNASMTRHQRHKIKDYSQSLKKEWIPCQDCEERFMNVEALHYHHRQKHGHIVTEYQ